MSQKFFIARGTLSLINGAIRQAQNRNGAAGFLFSIARAVPVILSMGIPIESAAARFLLPG